MMRLRKSDQRISAMKNLGPVVEKDFIAAGVLTSDAVRKLGVKKAFLKMLDGRLKLGRSAKCCNALYLYAIYGAIHDLDWKDIPSSKKIKFKQFTEMLRKSGKYGPRS
jgi:hypothetical protein